MSQASEYTKPHPFWAPQLTTTPVPCYRGCGEIVKVEHMEGDRISKWHECWDCRKKASYGSFNRSGATI